MIKRRFTQAQKKQVAARQKWTCLDCAKILPSSYQVDHIVPLWQGGEDNLENAQALCPDCHAEKTQHEAIERAHIRRSQQRDKHFRRPALQCLGCGFLTSPFFFHTCPGAPSAHMPTSATAALDQMPLPEGASN